MTATRLGKGDDLVVGDTSLVETLRLGANLGAASEAVKDNAPPLIVNIDGSWEMKRRVNLMSLDQVKTRKALSPQMGSMAWQWGT